MNIKMIDLWSEQFTSTLLYNWIVIEKEYWFIWGLLGGTSIVIALMLRNGLLSFISFLCFLISIIAQPLLYLLLPSLSQAVLGDKFYLEEKHLQAYGVGFIVSALVCFVILRYLVSWMDDIKTSVTKKTNQERDTRTDIRSISQYLPKSSNEFDPENYFRKNQMFCGLDAGNEPVYLPTALWRSSHADIVGTTGSGKGVMAGMLLTQAVRQGEAVIVIDPKNDEFAYRVMSQAAKKSGVPFYYLDFLGEVAQWNPFQGKSIFEIEELFSAGFGHSDKGSDADFYRLQDRASARVFAHEFSKVPGKVSKVYARILNEYEAVMKESQKFKEDLEEIASMPVLDIYRGIDLKKAIDEGAVIYLKGSMRNPRVQKLQKMFVLSVMQHCENRDRESARHVCMFLDEFKYLISKPALEALGAIRDKRAHVILAHQSLGDLRDCPKDIDPESVLSSINENCLLKIAYKVHDPDTAEWLAKMSGKILVDDERRKFVTDTAMTEKLAPERMLTQTERCLIDTNMLQSLPARCAAMYGNGLAKFIFASPIKVGKYVESMPPTVFIETEDVVLADKPKNSRVRSIAEELVNVDSII